jgi:ferric enterobactin receptor
MKIIYISVTCLLMNVLCVFNLQAQTGYRISGLVTDSATQKVLDFVTVNLKSDQDATSRTLISKDDGTFAFTGLKAAKYSVSVISMGYRSKTVSVELSADKDLGTIQLLPVSGSLAEVVISGQKPLIRQEADRISYNLQADPDSKGSSVIEMMRKIPYLSVDGDENVMMKGNTNFKVFINGKPSGMMERNFKEILKSMPAATIERIEVITNPPSKYDAEGLAGIINIITQKRVGNGYNASININERFPVGGPGAGTSFIYRQGKFGLSLLGGGSLSDLPVNTNSAGRTTSGSIPTTLIQSGSKESDGRNGYGGSELSYELDSLNLLSAQFNISGSRSAGVNTLSSLLTNSGGTLQGFDLDNNTLNKGNGMDATLNYQLGFKANKNELLTFSYRYMNYGGDQNNDLGIINRINYTTPDYKQISSDEAKEQTYQIDYVHPVKKVNIELGVKAILRDNVSDYQYLFKSGGMFVLDPTRTNTFNNEQNILAGYNSYRFSLKKWNFQAGIRVEKTIVHANFISAAATVNQNYFNVVPTVSASTKFKDQSSMNFGFSQRVSRPGIKRLNPFVDDTNPGFETTGNPNLRADRINAFQAGYSRSKKISLNLGMEIDAANKLTLPVARFDAARNVTVTTQENNGDVLAIVTNANINYPVTKKLSLSLNGNAIRFWITGKDNGAKTTNNILLHSLTLSSGYRFDSGWRISGSLTEVSRNPTGFQGSTNGMVTSSLGLNKDIVKDKLSFSATGRNLFNKYRNNSIETTGTDFSQFSESRDYFRAFSTSLNYRFGKLKEGIKKNKREIKNDDVSNKQGM